MSNNNNNNNNLFVIINNNITYLYYNVISCRYIVWYISKRFFSWDYIEKIFYINNL